MYEPGYKIIEKSWLLYSMSNVCCLASFHYLSSQYLIPQAAQAHYVWVRASEVIWSEYTRIISVLSDAK